MSIKNGGLDQDEQNGMVPSSSGLTKGFEKGTFHLQNRIRTLNGIHPFEQDSSPERDSCRKKRRGNSPGHHSRIDGNLVLPAFGSGFYK